MRTSKRELLGLTSAAALGMGYPHGLSDDLARAVAWLIERDADGLAALFTTRPRLGEPPNYASRPVIIDGLHVGSDGPGLLDLLVAQRLRTGDRSPGRSAGSDNPWSLQLRRLDSPLLMIGLCGTMANAIDVNFDLAIGYGGVLSVDGTEDAARLAALDLDAIAVAVGISCGEASAGSGVLAPPTRLFIPDARWSEAEALAARTYVPASEHSRHRGAGAGLTDND